MPSNSIESWAAVITTEPVLVEGHTNRPRSIRLENRHMPWPSYQSSLTRSPRLPRKANSAPECGLSSRTCCVITARPPTPLHMSVAPPARHIHVNGASGILPPDRQHPPTHHGHPPA